MTARAKYVVGTVVVGTMLGIGVGTAMPVADADISAPRRTAATVAIEALVDDDATAAIGAIPIGFENEYYRPTLEDGRAVAPDGDCSSPVPLPTDFESACKAHDLGYDLLRFGAAHGAPASPDARTRLDAALSTSMDDACDGRLGTWSRASCFVMSDIASTAVDFNSWRQNYRSPAPEPALPFLITGGVLTTAAAAATTVAGAVLRRLSPEVLA
ncbi:hypothetical protein CH289_24865 [Rhodococcus sp. RS1C4]|uniref:hypothetical protein n=1 Tax=Rhodococcus sp. 114MFTsu3.1 TaxID=1172184 RepID=UPI00037D5779|nr:MULTISPECIES: hypothetical protein [unclassified Rhodococcus (in: high G+C Gram-positive bacteria)]OZC45160.1 hypothetical protein CH289_24865 [Rhodococcus sp. RS1C4]OZC89676.1 hypothetical protein CH282_06985 [Rhodococcus sp. 06-418-1B]OZE77016.1 hypothetical protein CH304_25785 [Rhodococcus sp. 15-649-1-2]